jgi:aspartate racemase
MILHSIEFGPVAELQRAGKWEELGQLMARSALGLERAGAEGIVITSNTMHQVADAVEDAVRIPLLHIVDPTGEALETAGVKRAGLIGTRYTMELPFWKDRMARRFGIEIITPEAEDRSMVHRGDLRRALPGARFAANPAMHSRKSPSGSRPRALRRSSLVVPRWDYLLGQRT